MAGNLNYDSECCKSFTLLKNKKYDVNGSYVWEPIYLKASCFVFSTCNTMVMSATNQIAGNASHDYQYDDYTNSNQQYNYPPNYQHQISGESIQIVVNDVDIDPQQKYDSKYILREKNISPDLNWILSQMIAPKRNLNKLVTVVVVEVPLQIQLQEKLPSITKKLQKVPLIMGMVYAWLDNWILILRLDESYGSTLEDQLMLEVLSTNFFHF